MMGARRVGLTLGKFAPLHKGHQLIIEKALSEMEEVIILIYNCPDIIRSPLEQRAGWIKTLYPEATVIEAPDGPLTMGATPEIMKMHEDYILKKLDGKSVTHFYSSEFYGDHVSRALGAANALVDPDRKVVPVSGTMIRENPYKWRQYIHPTVYRDLIMNIVFVGAPSTGKTTIARHMAESTNTVWMPEYGREYWDAHQVDRRLSTWQLVEIAEGHLAREDSLLLGANKYMFTDTEAITTYLFSHYYHGTADKRLVELADKSSSRYAMFFLCDLDIPYEDTWDRSGEMHREEFQLNLIKELDKRGIHYTKISGSTDERAEAVLSAISPVRA